MTRWAVVRTMENSIATQPNRWYFVLRSLAAVIDYVVFGVFLFAYIYYFGTETDEGYRVDGCGHVLPLFVAWVIWLPLPEFVLGKTLGKWACDLRVVNLDNGRITFGQAFVRHLLDAVDLGGFFGLVAFIVARTNPLNQRLGDLVAKTLVVGDPMSEPDV
jgi:uncharacterized RDD family membrane protein YckC